MPTVEPDLWQRVLLHLRRHHPDVCRKWFEQIEPLDLSGGTFTLGVPNPVQLNYLRKRCADAFRESAQRATGALVAVTFILGNEDPALSSKALPPGARGTYDIPSERPDDEIPLNPDYTFEQFVTGPENRLPHAAAVAVAQQPGQAYNPLFVHGGVGLGKTHLLQAICQAVLQTQPQAHICYVSCDVFVNRFMDCVQSGQMSQFRDQYRHLDMLLIDDIHFLANRERTQEEFFHTFNTLYQANKQIVISSDSAPDEIPQLEARLVSRFNWGLVARVDAPGYETRLAILYKKAAARGLVLPEDVATYIASSVDSNTRVLEGMITRIQSLAAIQQTPITLDLARTALGEDAPENKTSPLTIQNIIDAVTSFYGVKLSDLQSRRRHRSISIPRQVCMYLARKRTCYSLEEIGGYFGGRDHTTVMHAIRSTEGRMGGLEDFTRQVEEIDRLLTQHLKV